MPPGITLALAGGIVGFLYLLTPDYGIFDFYNLDNIRVPANIPRHLHISEFVRSTHLLLDE